MRTWKKFFPDYEIKRWDETNFDIDCCAYVKQAYKEKKYAFVSDYARIKILYENGGLYFDTDVEIVKTFDKILQNGDFVGCELNGSVNPGLGLGAKPGNILFKEFLELYEKLSFYNDDGSLNLKTIVQYTTELLTKYGLTGDDKIQDILDLTVYPKDFFNPTDMNNGKIIITENTVSIHHYSATWSTPRERIGGKIYYFISRVFGNNFAEAVRALVGRKNDKK